MKKKLILALAACLLAVICSAQVSNIDWTWSVVKTSEDACTVQFSGKIAPGFHTYSIKDELSPTEFLDPVLKDAEFAGPLRELGTPSELDGSLVFEGSITLEQDFLLTGPDASFSGSLFANTCDDGSCVPSYLDFEISLAPAEKLSTVTAQSTESNKSGSIWSLILEAILWGFAMLLTPCVFPMVPMTVSFFMKGSGSPAAGRFKACMYGLFIVLLYTVPISLIILLTRLLGGATVTADIFNWLATHWLPNIIFFIVFMVFAASFFGAFEIVLPSKWTNAADKNSDRSGLGGVFFLALTLVLVSFSCTGPIVGTVLIKSTQGEFWTPMVTMLAFSVAFALPFTLLAFFPSLIKKVRKSSGSWLGSVKVVLGFIELAFGMKFLSTADQTYHWGLLDREVYLAIWIVIFSLLGFYLLGKICFKHEEKVESIGVTRLALAIAVLSFVVYLVPGMWGAPLKALSGYLPPISTQDFVLGGTQAGTFVMSESSLSGTDDNSGSASAAGNQLSEGMANRYGLELPLGLKGYFNIDEGLAAARQAGKPLFVDVTGHGCVNCREMEARVWSDPQVLSLLSNEYVIVALYNDDKQKLPEPEWITDSVSGKVYKDLGRVNSYIARTRWGVNAQPNYVLLAPDGTQLLPVRGYDLSVEGFVKFLNDGLEAFRTHVE